MSKDIGDRESIFMVNGKFPKLTKEMKSKYGYNTKKEQVASSILNSVSIGIRNEFEQSKKVLYDANTKGGNYEKIVSAFLQKYFGGFLDFYERAQIMDIQLNYLDLFPRGANNFDVVATYRTAVPRLVLRIRDTAIVPLESVAFVVEVKQDMTKTFLRADLKKLRKLSDLEFSTDRMALSISSEYEVDRPVRILIYGSASVKDTELYRLLDEYTAYWDILIVVDSDQIWISPSLPTILHSFKEPQIFYCPIHGMYQGIITLAEALPVPLRVDTSAFFHNLLMIGEPP